MGSFNSVTSTCLYHVQLTTVCIRVELKTKEPDVIGTSHTDPDWVLADYTEPIPSNATSAEGEEEQAQVEPPYGCIYSSVEGQAWTVGLYHPIPDPYAGEKAPSKETDTNPNANLNSPQIGNDGRMKLLGKTRSRTGRLLLQLDDGGTSSIISSGISVSSSSTADFPFVPPSSSAPADVPPQKQSLIPINLVIRHKKDPFLTAQQLTQNTLYFHFPKLQLVLLSFLLFFLSLSAAGPRWWIGYGKQWWAGFQQQMEQGAARMNEQVNRRKKRKKGNQGKKKKKGGDVYVNVAGEEKDSEESEGDGERSDDLYEDNENSSHEATGATSSSVASPSSRVIEVGPPERLQMKYSGLVEADAPIIISDEDSRENEQQQQHQQQQVGESDLARYVVGVGEENEEIDDENVAREMEAALEEEKEGELMEDLAEEKHAYQLD